jgi:hypothetical protein
VLAVDHADEAAFDGNVHALVAGRDHARAGGACDEQVRGDLEVGDQSRWDRTAARFDAPGAIEQQDAAPLPRQVVRCGGTRRASTDDDHVVVGHVHVAS